MTNPQLFRTLLTSTVSDKLPCDWAHIPCRKANLSCTKIYFRETQFEYVGATQVSILAKFYVQDFFNFSSLSSPRTKLFHCHCHPCQKWSSEALAIGNWHPQTDCALPGNSFASKPWMICCDCSAGDWKAMSSGHTRY